MGIAPTTLLRKDLRRSTFVRHPRRPLNLGRTQNNLDEPASALLLLFSIVKRSDQVVTFSLKRLNAVLQDFYTANLNTKLQSTSGLEIQCVLLGVQFPNSYAYITVTPLALTERDSLTEIRRFFTNSYLNYFVPYGIAMLWSCTTFFKFMRLDEISDLPPAKIKFL